jgi:hypothetical protein
MFSSIAATAAALPFLPLVAGAADTANQLISYFASFEFLRPLPVCSAVFEVLLLA